MSARSITRAALAVAGWVAITVVALADAPIASAIRAGQDVAAAATGVSHMVLGCAADSAPSLPLLQFGDCGGLAFSPA